MAPDTRVIERAEVVFAVRIVVVGERIERDHLGEDRGLILRGQGGGVGRKPRATASLRIP
jgi:hypothetical protein